jgi:UDP-N-acetylglucosamine 1-carboxyvinyltransferase
VHARAMNGKHLVGGHFCLDYPSVGATETLMMAAALADGKSTLSNVAQRSRTLQIF